ncbi:MAG: hypothetical protein FWF03_01230 [Defluviitaleaceae bacterium]|nr:hypothetical protein [Defluviitaleaceae bacterium]
MVDSRLVLVEGLPSTGKTTNARFINIQLERSCIDARWIHEVALPHPALFFDEAGLTYGEYAKLKEKHPETAGFLDSKAEFRANTVGINPTELKWEFSNKINGNIYGALSEYDVWKFPPDKYIKFALDKWARFTETALKKRDEVQIADSAFFQYQIFKFLLSGSPVQMLQDFVGRLFEIVRPLNPRLIYLYRENTEATIDFLENDRGTQFLEKIWERDKEQPYYAKKPPGAEGFKRFLRDYARFAKILFDDFGAKKIAIDITGRNWVCIEDEMLSFLGVGRAPDPVFMPLDGVYANEDLGLSIKVEGLAFTDSNGQARKLIPKSPDEFYVDLLPAVLRFENGGIIILGSQICERWTKTGTIYQKAR